MAPGALPVEVFQGCLTGRRPKDRPVTCWRDYVSQLALKRLGIPPAELAELKEVAGKKEVDASLFRLLSPRSDSGYAAEDGWMDGLKCCQADSWRIR